MRVRIFFSFLAALLPVIVFILLAVKFFLVPAIAGKARQELANSTHLLTGAVQAGATVAVRNHLKGIAEKNREIVAYHYGLFEQGRLSKTEALGRVRDILLSQQIGSSGYIYCLDSQGNAVIHPNSEIEGTDNTAFAFVREQMRRKNGYIEYEWQNPGETSTRQKALYMVYFEPLDWIISVSSYRQEFNELVNINDFREAILSLRFGTSGYSYVINEDGETLVHPKLPNFNALRQSDLSSEFVRTMIATGTGSLEYRWQNPDETAPKAKIAVYERIPEYGWIIVSSSYIEEVMKPAYLLEKVAYLSILLLLATGALASFLLSGRLARPVNAMIERLDANARSRIPRPLPVPADEELGRLAREFNSFLTLIEDQNRQLFREKEKYQSLFVTSPDAIFLLQGQRLIDCNPATLSMFAADKEALLGCSVVDLSPSVQAGGASTEILVEETIRRTGADTLQTFEWIHRRLDGGLFDAEVRLRPFGSQEGGPLMVAFVRDITERKKAEDALRQSEYKYRQLIESASDAIFIAANGSIAVLNGKAEQLTGYGGDELKKISFAEIIHDDDRHMVAERHVQRLRGESGLPDTYTFRLITREGDERTVQLSCSRIEWDGKPATLNFVRDITEHKRLEKVLHQAQKMEAIGTLAGGIAHDFNNILMGVLGRISLMRVATGRASSESEHLQAMEEYIQSAVGLTRQLLGFARGGKYEPKPVEIGELIADSAQMFGRTRKELTLHVDTVAGPLVCEVDSRQIEQVLLNMYVNAWQAMEGGGELHLRTSAETLEGAICRLHQVEPGRYAKISITDSGCGMDETTLQRIFDPFFTTKEKSRGTGLGLASAYGIIRNHKGFITVYSEPGHGATFTIYLPLSESQPLSEAVVEEVVFRGEGHILLVDDEQMITEVGRSMLNQLGYSVSTAGSGREALALLEAQGERIDMVLLDLIMPGMDGGAVFDAIRRLHPAMPVILSSGYSLNGYATEIMARGCSGFIQKPFNLAELSRKLHEVIGDARSQDGETKKP